MHGLLTRAVVLGVNVVACLAAIGCEGLDASPMAYRADESAQRVRDEYWRNLIASQGMLDRDKFLHALMEHQPFQFGIDTLRLSSRKVSDGQAIEMEITYERSKPSWDAFSVIIRAENGEVIRREVYSREDVEQQKMDFGLVGISRDNE